jgi:SOS-response transcriptional repressor LexA
MGVKENSAQWIDQAYGDWFHWLRNDKGQSYLRDSTRNIVDRMKKAADDPARGEEAWNTLERLKRLANSFNNLDDVSSVDEYMYEPPEINVECALTAYNLGDLQEALMLLKISNSSFPARRLHKAISYWLSGCIQWQSQYHLEDALVSWEKSIQITKDIKADKSTDLTTAKKCEEMLEQMIYAIREASKTNSPPPVPPKKGASKTRVKARSAKLMTYPIYGRIPAGPPAWVPDEPEGYSEVESVTLNDKEYQFFSLHVPEEFTINVHGGRTYFLLEVNGNSMNMTKPISIMNGDYVLMAKQDAAESGDIVAAEIVREDTAATLKRYRFKDGKHRLEPETNDPTLAEHISMTKDFYIRGIALAVLKPVE